MDRLNGCSLASTAQRTSILAALLFGALACSGGDEVDGGPGEPDSGVVDGGPDGGPTDGGPVAECDKAPNVARRTALLAAQPVLESRGRQITERTVTFPSEADDPAVLCPVTLSFKDLDGDGDLTPYEDWRLSPEERAADLVGRMSLDQKAGLMAHPTTSDVPSGDGAVSAALRAAIEDRHIRFALTAANGAALSARATWANEVQALCEAEPLAIPFVLSMAPSHTSGNGRVKATGFSQWPNELSLAASGDPSVVEGFGRVVSQEYRAIGVRMALSPSADLATEPRWFESQFTFGEDGTAVGEIVKAYVRGVQGATLGPDGVACVVGRFPGAGAAKDGWDARLEKGMYTTYPGGEIDAHLAPFGEAIAAGVAGVMPGYGVPERGTWTGLGGVLNGATIEQVGAAFNREIVGDALRAHYGFGGLVLAPWGILDDAPISSVAPWGMEASTKAERIAKAVTAGVDQFGGLDETQSILEARTTGGIDDTAIDAAARRALALTFALGLFEDPYVDAARAPALCNTDTAYRAGLRAMNQGMVLLVNRTKPVGWLDGNGDGTQVGDKGNAGNGTLKVLPAPPGEPYVSAGCSYFVMGNFDLDYVRSVSTGYGALTNDALSIKDIPVSTPEERIALSDYVFIRVDAPFTVDPDSGPMSLPRQSLEYATNANADVLDQIAFARAAIDGWIGPPASQAQIVVGVTAGRPSVVDEILAFGPSALYVDWYGKQPANLLADKIFLDVAFGIVDGTGKLPVGLPASDGAAAAQLEDTAGDGQHDTFVHGFGISTEAFE